MITDLIELRIELEERLDRAKRIIDADFPGMIPKDAGAAYYNALYAMCELMYEEQPIKALDMGTFEGFSARVMAHTGAYVDTIDISMESVRDMDALTKECHAVMLVDPDYWREIDYGKYDFIFVDMAHDGETEKEIHKLLEDQYSGFVFYDDIALTDVMIGFWETIPKENKLFTPEFHTISPSMVRPAGFGIVKYNL